jgi:hypothetical protein
MYYLSVGAIFKNESHILEEWIEHYLFHGVDHFFLINDQSSDDYMPKLKKYIENGIVTLYHTLPKKKYLGMQADYYNEFFKNHKTETVWMAILDLDEFLYSPKTIDLKELLKEQENLSQIVVNWAMFGSNGFIKQPKSVVESFTKRSEYGHLNSSYKCIIKMADLIKFEIHKSKVTGSTANLSWEKNKEDPLLIINHYFLQSLEFWTNIKGTRGDCDYWFDTIGMKRDLDLFKSHDINNIEDLRLHNQNKSLKQ